jgi:hypothetical protein
MSSDPANHGPAARREARPRRHLAMRVLLEGAAGRSALLAAAPELPEPAGRWLAELCLLHGLPFNTLVPDARLLPAESVRFFVIDQNWLDALVDGALSVAAAAAPEAALTALHRPRLQAGARARATGRDIGSDAGTTGTGTTGTGTTGTGTTGIEGQVWTGVLLRSALVAGVPDLTVAGYPSEEPAEPLPVLRTDRVAPSVLIVIFDGFLRRAEIGLPAKGLHFGVIPSRDQPPNVAVRFIGGGEQFPPGVQPPGKPAVAARFRDPGRGVLDIQGLAEDLKTELASVYAPVTPPPLQSAALGIQLVAAPERRSFVAGHGG